MAFDKRHEARASRLAALAVGAAALGGCGVNLTANKVGALTEEMSKPGIYYSLPKTEAHISIPVSVEQLQAGRVGKVFDKCLSECKANPGTQPAQCALPGDTTVQILKPEIVLKGVPDPNHTYYVTMNTDVFASLKHQMTFDESGVISEASSSGTNMTFEVVSGVLQTVVSVVAGGMFPFAHTRMLPTDPKPPAVGKAAALTCAQALQIENDTLAFEGQVTKELQDLDKWLVATRKPSIDAEFAKLVIARSAERVAHIRDRLAKYRAGADLEIVKKTHRYTLRSVRPLAPDEFKDLPEAPLAFKQEAPTDEAQASAPSLMDLLTKARITFSAGIKRQGPLAKPCQDNACRIAEPAGYRYRMPAQGELVLAAHAPTKPNDATTITRRELVSEKLPFAQYGPIAALPSRFEGKGGSVELSISPVTGSLKKVTIGSEALPTTAVTAPLESVRAGLEERKKRKDTEELEARNADKTSLERERDLLKLQKEIRDLKTELGQ